jgi:PLP dependent protein
VKLEGLMTIGSSQEHEFMAMNEMRRQVEERLQQRLQLSMGMSNDWEVAVRCGASQVRMGRLIFGSGSVDKEHDAL